MKMYLNGREVKVLFFKDTGIFYVELLLREGDCPEKKEFPEVQLCSGDCQGTYLSAIVKENIVKIVGSIFPKPHIMYSEEFARKHHLRREEIASYTKDYLERNPYTVKSYMGGRKKRVYVKEEHVETVFEGCTFRVAEGVFDNFLTKLRKDELERITKNLEKIKSVVVPTTTRGFGKFIRL
jgi:hypothetical protein